MQPVIRQTTIKPLIGPEKTLPEITVKAVILSVFLIIILAASNAFLGLKVGTTISASIPAAVISMGILRFFRNHNVLENNIVQTAASTGEAMTAGIAFILPALIILRFWTHFNYWETVGIGLAGGILGVLFSVPLRRALLNDKTLSFPEGTAIGQVMKASVDSGTQLKSLVLGGIGGALIGLFQSGFRVLADSLQYWLVKGNVVFGFGLGFSPAVIAAGYIVGVNVAISMLVGIIIGWIIGVPILSAYYGFSPDVHNAFSIANQLWSDHIRFLGVGTMLVGGLWTLVSLFKPVVKGVIASLETLKQRRLGQNKILRTEHDMSINLVFWIGIVILAVVFMQMFVFIQNDIAGISSHMVWILTGVSAVYILIAGFVFSAVSGYFAGLVGSTNSPGSGLVVASTLILCLLVMLILGTEVHFSYKSAQTLGAAAVAVTACSFISAAMVIANETIQDLKAGQIVGATPWKQQVMLIVGVVVSAFVLPLILDLLFNAYGIGGVFPHAGMDHSQMLAAPQAGLVAAVAQGVFTRQLPWGMIGIGAGVAIICIIVDEVLKFGWGTRLPVLAVGVGIYLPLDSSTPVIIGGVLSYIVQYMAHRNYGSLNHEGRVKVKERLQGGLLLSCGIVAGAALLGVALAIPFAIKQSADALRIVPQSFTGISEWLSIIVTFLLCYWIYRVAVVAKK